MEKTHKLRIMLCQTDIKWADSKANINSIESIVDSWEQENEVSDAEIPRLYVLPEMWNTGFIMEPHTVAEKEDSSPALSWMKSFAASHDCAVCGSIPVETVGGTFRNRFYFVKPSDETAEPSGKTVTVEYYDKHHLFSYGGEHHKYTAGDSHVIVSYAGFRFLLLVCYDLRFPVWSRYGMAGEYDGIIIVANWPASRQTAWDILVQARAIENQCYVVAVNRVGDDSVSHYLGGSRVVDPIGRIVLECEKDMQGISSCDIDKFDLEKRRNRFRVLDDRDIL